MKRTDEKVWDEIAELWSIRRNILLKEVSDFLRGKKGKVLDLCCGSGRNFCKIEGEFYGVDFSEKMLEKAQERAGKVGIKCILKKANADKLPFENNFFDCAIFIAGLHCIKNLNDRRKALKELFRVLKINRKVLISVWSKNNKRIKGKSGEGYVPWTVGDKKIMRYYYIYESNEFKKEIEAVGFKVVKIWEGENIWVEAEK